MAIFDQAFDRDREAALVTGAANGIGRAIALALVGEGVRTVFADINARTVEAAVKAAANPKLALSWVGDLARQAECDWLLADARSQLGLITLFVHSASPPRHEKDHALAVLSNRISGYVTGASFLIDGGLSLTNWFDPPELDLP